MVASWTAAPLDIVPGMLMVVDALVIRVMWRILQRVCYLSGLFSQILKDWANAV